MDLAGPSQPLAHWNPTGTFWAKERTSPSLSNNLLIVLATSITTVAEEDFLPMLSNISDMLEVSNQMLPIPTLPRTDSASSEDKLQLDM